MKHFYLLSHINDKLQIIPDEGDVERMVGEGQYRALYNVAQENLEAVTERPDMLVRHRNLGAIFPLGFDFSSGTYRVSHKLRYCFPNTDATAAVVGGEFVRPMEISEIHPVAPAFSSSSTSSSAATAILNSNTAAGMGGAESIDRLAQEQAATAAAAAGRVYRLIDNVLVELLTTLRQSFSASRRNDAAYRKQTADDRSASFTSPPPGSNNSGGAYADADAAVAHVQKTEETDSNVCSNGGDVDVLSTKVATPSPPALSALPVLDMQDLLALLKYARTQEQALYVESALWLIWVSHDSPDINSLMRLSIAHAKRGNAMQAIEVVSKAIELDPLFAEAHNKRASYHHMLQQHDECIQHAKSALELFPDHVGALSGLSLCYEQRGEGVTFKMKFDQKMF